MSGRPPGWSGPGRALREKWALEAEAKKPCPQCGHTERHNEPPHTLYEFDDSGETPTIRETPNPDYQPLHFHCTHEGCECVLVLTP